MINKNDRSKDQVNTQINERNKRIQELESLLNHQEKNVENLEKSKSTYQSIIQNMNHGYAYHKIIVEDGIPRDYEFLEVNRAFEKLTGLNRENILGKKVTEVLPGIENDPADWIGVYGKVALRNPPITFEQYSEALKKWYSVTAFSSEKGYFVTIFSDISKQVEERTQFREISQQFEIIFDSVPVMIFYKDKEGRVIRCNMALAKALGKEKEEIEGKIINEVLTNQTEQMDKDDREVIESGQPKLNIIEHYQTPTKLRWGKTDKLPYRDEKGNVIGVIGFSVDVTERKKTERTVQEVREYAENIVETVREPLVILDAELHMVSANRAFYQTFKVTKEENENQMLYELGNRQWDIPRLRELLEEILSQNTTFEAFEVEHDFETIGPKTMLLNARQIKREANKVQLILLAIEDITKQKKLEEELKKTVKELERSNVELEKFAHIASHDLQEPLRMIISFIQLLAKRYKDKLDSEAQEYIDYTLDGANRMSQLINDLLAYSRVIQGKEFQSSDVSGIITQAMDNLQLVIEENNAEITNGPLPEELVCDSSQICQVFQNLIENAIKFRREGTPSIHISAKKLKTEWKFSIKDNGIGIEKQYFDRIFVIFQRLHTRKEYPGTGIGLAICKRIIRHHGGRIWVKSKPGKGSTFYFTIPTQLASITKWT